MDRSQTETEGHGQTHPPELLLSATSADAPDYLAEQVRAWEEAGGLVESSIAATAAGSPLEQELASELDAVRQRLAYYERFDSLINDSIQRSADLFQALFAEREQQRLAGNSLASEISAAAEAEAERRIAAERRRMHESLMVLMTDAGRLQRQVDGLIQQIAEAVTDLSTRGGSSYDDPPPGP